LAVNGKRRGVGTQKNFVWVGSGVKLPEKNEIFKVILKQGKVGGLATAKSK